jgi:hypothetical protein
VATEQQVRDEALQMLGVIDIGDSASGTDDDTFMQQKYTEVYKMLKKDGLNYWASGSTVPDEYKPHVAAIMAYFSLDQYSVGAERLQRITSKTMSANKEIRKLGQPQYESTDHPRDF